MRKSEGGLKSCRKVEGQCISHRVTLAPFVVDWREMSLYIQRETLYMPDVPFAHLPSFRSLSLFLYKLSPPKRSWQGNRHLFCLKQGLIGGWAWN